MWKLTIIPLLDFLASLNEDIDACMLIECMLVWESTRFGNVFECMLVWERVRNMHHTFSHVFVNNLNICSGIVWKSLEQS